MGASDWPTWWVLLAPAMMLAFMAMCMFGMRWMMGGMHGRHDRSLDGGSGGSDPARTWWHVPARFPDAQSAFEAWRAETQQGPDREQTKSDQLPDGPGTAKDKAEFDRFMAEHRKPPTPRT